MDDALRFVGAFMACLVGPVLFGWGLVWFVSHYWLYLLAATLFMGLLWGGWWLAARSGTESL